MMSKFYVSAMVPIDSAPFAPRSKMIAKEIGSALIGAGSSLIGNLLGFGSNSSANSTNLKIAQMNNELQYQMFKEQNAFNEDMWNKQNDYNLPKNQVARLLEAGINPSTVFGNGTVSEAGQLTSANAPVPQGAHVNPFTPDFSGVEHAANAYFENQLKNKAAQGTGLDNQAKQIDNQYKYMHHLGDLMEQKTRISKMISEMDKNSDERKFLQKQADHLDLEINKFRDTYNFIVDREKKQNDIMDAQLDNLLADSTLKRAQSQYQNILIKYYPKMANAQINQLTASANELIQRAANMVKEGILTDYKTTEQFLKNQLLNLTNSEEYQRHERNPKYSVDVAADVSGLADWLTDLLLHNLKLSK